MLAALACAPLAAADSGGYHYSGTAGLPLRPVVLRLDSVHVRAGHVAVWQGVAGGGHWVQAGIAYGAPLADPHHPYLYVEADNDLRVLRRVAFGQRVTVAGGCTGGWCWATAGGVMVQRWLPGPRTTWRGGESAEPGGLRNSYTAYVGGQLVHR